MRQKSVRHQHAAERTIVASAVDLEGNRYINLENAFRYRKEPVDGCAC